MQTFFNSSLICTFNPQAKCGYFSLYDGVIATNVSSLVIYFMPMLSWVYTLSSSLATAFSFKQILMMFCRNLNLFFLNDWKKGCCLWVIMKTLDMCCLSSDNSRNRKKDKKQQQLSLVDISLEVCINTWLQIHMNKHTEQELQTFNVHCRHMQSWIATSSTHLLLPLSCLVSTCRLLFLGLRFHLSGEEWFVFLPLA